MTMKHTYKNKYLAHCGYDQGHGINPFRVIVPDHVGDNQRETDLAGTSFVTLDYCDPLSPRWLRWCRLDGDAIRSGIGHGSARRCGLGSGIAQRDRTSVGITKHRSQGIGDAVSILEEK